MFECLARIPIRLRWKFAVLIVDLILLFGGLHIYLVKIHFARQMEDDLRLRLKAVASSLAHSFFPMLLYEDRVGLHKLLLETIRDEPRIRYVVVLDQSGTPILDTFRAGRVPRGLIAANALPPDREPRFARIQDVSRLRHTYLDIAYPLGSDRRFGTLRMGMDERGVRYAIEKMILSYVIMIIAFIVLGTIGAFVLARWIHHPIQRIQVALEAFDPSSPAQPEIDVRTGDELEGFAKAVEGILKRLKASHP